MTGTPCSSIPDFRVPDDLTERDQWVLWRREWRDGKPTKVPYQVSGKRADSTDPGTWAAYDQVLALWTQDRSGYTGLGFVFSADDPLAGIDLDDCLDQHGAIKHWARGTVERLSDTYMEVSPSGNGVKIWVRGSLPANLGGVKVKDGAIELYDRARYFAVTGRAFRGAPLEIEDHAADLLALYHQLTGGGKKWPLQPLPGGQIPHGRQHNTLVSICGTLRVRGVCEEAIESCLQILNEKQCERPGPREHVSRIVRSSRKWQKSS
jgi:hypothetical protein